jgi:CRP/FNR family cyclic AMP-dependent transcriptional regulator
MDGFTSDQGPSVVPGDGSNCRLSDNCAMSPDVRALFDLNFPDIRWSERQWIDAESRLRTRRLAPGATLFAEGDPTPALFGVLSGCIQARLSSARGEMSVVENVEPGRTFGLASFAAGLPSSYEALALKPTRLLVVGPAAYAWLMDEVPGFSRALLREFARRFDGNLKLLEASRHRDAEERLCIALQRLRSEGRATPGAPGGWRMALTQSELATRANVSRQTANEWLAQWAARGWIARRYGALEITRWPTPQAASAASTSARIFSGLSVGA